ncbi:MAG: DUF2860 family protein [Desulfobacterales bacterium]
MPQDSGVSGFINLGVGVITAKSNMIAGNSLADIGKSRIDSLTDSPDSESDVILVLNGELAYTLVSTRTQVFIGNSFEDFIRFEATTMAGARQELPDSSIVALSYLFSAIPTEVWADPYVVGQNRSKTDRTSPCLRLDYDKILGSDFEIRFAWRDIDLDDERSGLTQLGLPLDSAKLLDREGDSYEIEVVNPIAAHGNCNSDERVIELITRGKPASRTKSTAVRTLPHDHARKLETVRALHS